MLKERLELHKDRQMGEVIEVAFAFLREEGSNFWQILLSVSGAFLVLTYAPLLWLTMNTKDFLATDADTLFFAVLLFGYLLMASIALVTNAYIKAMHENDMQSPGLGAVWQVCKRYALPTGLWMVLFAITAFLGAITFVLWVLPIGFLGFLASVIVFENAGFSALGRSVNLGGVTFVETVGGIILMLLLMTLLPLPFIGLSAATQLVDIIIEFVNVLPEATTMALLEIIGMTLLLAYAYICVTVLFVALAFQYFSALERKEGASFYDKIEEIGTNSSYYDEV